MNRSMFAGRYLIILIVLVVVLLRWPAGVWDWHRVDYKCQGVDEGFALRSKVELFRWGSFHLFAYPLTRDCPATDHVPADWVPTYKAPAQ